jgi:hypothetical protein
LSTKAAVLGWVPSVMICTSGMRAPGCQEAGVEVVGDDDQAAQLGRLSSGSSSSRRSCAGVTEK